MSITKIVEKGNLYLRIATDYYKKVEQPLFSGDTYKRLIKWKKGEIITDEGKDYIDGIKKYDGFCLIPSHTNYKREINSFYNEYEKLDYELEEGSFSKTETFLKHIFGDHYLLGLDYLSILWKHPTQILPILCLVSSERNTGKTTFLKWLKMIFQGNMTINKNEDFRSRFNSDWSSKLIISVDEVLLDRKEDSERIKNLSTASSYKTESKGIDKVESFFFGKFILCSNNEENFIYVDDNEIRYWVLKVPTFTNEEPDLLLELKKEIPYFVNFLNKRTIKTVKKTRMWFTKDQIQTDALKKLIKGKVSSLSTELLEILKDDFSKYEVDELKYTAKELLKLLLENNIRVTTTQVKEVLVNHFELESKNGSYPKYHMAINPKDDKFITEKTTWKGRYYTFIKSELVNK